MASYSDDRYKAALTCGICQDILTEPRALPCMHAYCLKCLDSLIQKGQLQGGSFNCPECRHVCTIPQEGAWEFKVSPTISFLVDAFKDSQHMERPECDSCLQIHEKHTLAKIRCLDCDKKLCIACGKNHDFLLKGHKIIELTGDSAQDLQTALQSIKERTVYCQLHPTKPIELYCKVDKMLICHQCYPIDHPGHACEDIKKIAKKNMKPIGAVITQGKALMDIYEQAIQDTQAYKSQLEQDAERTTAEINNDMNTLIQAIRKKYKSHTEQVMKEKESNVKQAVSHIGYLELQKAIIEGQVNKYCTMVEHGHPVEIAGLLEHVNLKFEEWSKKPKIALSSKTKFQFNEGKCREDGIEFGRVAIEKIQGEGSDNVATPLSEPTLTITHLHPSFISDLTVTLEGDYVATGRECSTTRIYDRNYKLKRDLKRNFWNVTLKNDGNLAFTDGLTNTISIYSSQGDHQNDIVCKGISKLWGIAMDPAGEELLVIDHKTKKVYSIDQSTGESKALSGSLNNPLHLMSNSKQVHIISDWSKHYIEGIARDGKQVFKYGSEGSADGQLKHPWGVCRDKRDCIFVADSHNQRVVLLTPTGRFVRNVLTREDGLNCPYAVTIGNDGKLLVGDNDGNYLSSSTGNKTNEPKLIKGVPTMTSCDYNLEFITI